MRIVLLGPQGVGKGTQAQRLSKRIGAPHVSTGDLVRAEIAAQTPLGQRMKDRTDGGELVPDDLIVSLALSHLDGKTNWILDGFPRTLAQARALDEALAGVGELLDCVLALQAPDAEVVERLSGRRQSEATGRIYNLANDPPPPDDPGPFVQREDDHPDNIRRRLELYHTETEPLKGYYAERGLLREIDSTGPIDAVTDAILAVLNALPSRTGKAPLSGMASAAADTRATKLAS